MKHFRKSLLAAMAMSLFAMSANATIITSLLGDKDCFGIAAQGGSPCATGLHYVNDLGGTFFEDNRSGDPLVTDIWHTGSQSFVITIAGLGGSVVSASLDLFHAGAGTVTPGSISVNAVDFGGFGGGDNLSTLTTYDITAVVTGSNTVDITLSGGDGWSLDYAELTVETVSEPLTLGLMGLGLIGLGLRRRRL